MGNANPGCDGMGAGLGRRGRISQWTAGGHTTGTRLRATEQSLWSDPAGRAILDAFQLPRKHADRSRLRTDGVREAAAADAPEWSTRAAIRAWLVRYAGRRRSV